MRTHIHTCIHTYIHTYIYTHTHTHTHIRNYACVFQEKVLQLLQELSYFCPWIRKFAENIHSSTKNHKNHECLCYMLLNRLSNAKD